MSDESGHGLIWAAVITVAGGIVVAAIGFFKPGDSGGGQKISVDRTHIEGPAYIGNTFNGPVPSKFDAENGISIDRVGGDYTTGSSPPSSDKHRKPSGLISARITNHSNRDITNVRMVVLAEGDSSAEQPLVSVEREDIPRKDYAIGTMEWHTAMAPPDRIRICLTFESQKSGEFITVLVSGIRVQRVAGSGQSRLSYHLQPFIYQLKNDAVAFRSNHRDNCSLGDDAEKIDISDSKIYR